MPHVVFTSTIHPLVIVFALLDLDIPTLKTSARETLSKGLTFSCSYHVYVLHELSTSLYSC